MKQLKSSQFMNEKHFPFWIDFKVHTEENIPPVHVHDFIELVYVTHGKAEHIFEGKRYEVCAGDVFIVNPGEVHTYNLIAGKELGIINCLFLSTLIDDIWLSNLGVSEAMDYFYIHPFLNQKERFHHCLNLRGTCADTIYVQFEKMAEEFNSQKEGYATLIRLQLVQMLMELSRIYRQQQSYTRHWKVPHEERKVLVQRIWGYLERHFDQKLTLAGLSALYNISSRHLNRVFKAETGQTVIEAVHHIRIKRAKVLLSETPDKVICIAMDVGYEDPAFFTRLFTRQVGCSPGKYRELSTKTLQEAE
ncbi:AraC family transcriptional regulator [Salibacterium halotolerans]|uniref:AraC-like ligand binding domain-containing protein n=1 Tax=Salibacterium halotolerans TaxID=1884432 RepID=A0A1I5PRD1_9BACI|nr:AraC family transcriptional regulator [Salibacterium halotolerans]SFP36559.1 AraC-like ligand binding domain-containing protein [Salibacterium halotolerans]